MWYALYQYELESKKRTMPLVADPQHSGKFLFKKEQKFSNVGLMTLTFKPNGEVLAYNYAFFLYYDYYIQKTANGEEIVMFKNPNKPTQVTAGSTLLLYNGRRAVCYENSIALGVL